MCSWCIWKEIIFFVRVRIVGFIYCIQVTWRRRVHQVYFRSSIFLLKKYKCYLYLIWRKFCLLARLQTWRALFSAVCLSVCLYVCLWPALLPFNVDRFWRNLVTRTYCDLVWPRPKWSRSAAEDRVTPSWKFQKISKITEFEFQNSGPSFFCVCVSCVL